MANSSLRLASDPSEIAGPPRRPLGYTPLPRHFDGLVSEPGRPWPASRKLCEYLDRIGVKGLQEVQQDADLSLLNQGITFTVYADDRGTEKIFPLDVIPRIITADRWRRLEAGLQQRIHALNLFLADLYGPQRILRDGVVPTELAVNSPNFCRGMKGVDVPGGVFVHVAGVDLIEDEHGEMLVLEDNVRVPSGVSYVIENRIVTSRVMPDLLQDHGVRRVGHYPQLLLDALRAVAPIEQPVVAVLTPGTYNSAYFEHSFLAAQMGVALVEGRDLVVDDDAVYMKTTAGLTKVDVLYRRVDDDFLDPVAFRDDSVLGVPGLMNAYRSGNVVLANAPGTGVVDDKAMYAFIPDAIRYYLGEEPLLAQVPTYLGRDSKQLKFILDHLEELVVKPTDGSGGYGLLVGSAATGDQLADMRRSLSAAPELYVAQPIQRLSTLPALVGIGRNEIAPRHVDLRPFAVSCAPDRVEVLPGGLTRVALREGNLVVNSSQGGGSKDTWVLSDSEGDPGC